VNIMNTLKIKTAQNADVGVAHLPIQFSEAVRPDLIQRAVLAIQAANRQAYGGYGDAGMRHSTRVSRRRRDYRGSYGKGISRVPRKVHTRRGMQMNWVGALAAGTVGGRRAHPPKPFKDWSQKINTTENRKAIRSALAATINASTVTARGHKLPKDFPFFVDDAFEQITTTKQLEIALVQLGFADELDRASVTRIRAGKGKMRGRKHKTPTSMLFVVGKDSTALARAARNLPGADVVAVHRVNAELLAPGAAPGRLAIFTKAAIDRLSKEGLFLNSYKGATPQKKAAPAKQKSVPKKAPVKAAKKAARKSEN
jgi:large subunit ribosomal protein L4e